MSISLRPGLARAKAGLWLALLLTVGATVASCAKPPTDPDARAAFEEANDPLEPLNRKTFAVNLFLDHNAIKPVAEAYRWVPIPFRSGIHNVLQTLITPALFANQVMQGRFGDARDTTLRLAANLTIGFGGIFDPADDMFHIPKHETDFGVTLAKWGVPDGPYLVLPLFGPSSPRDTGGLIVDGFMDPLSFYIPWWGDVIRTAVDGIDKREPLIEPLDELERTSVDFYATLRSLYRQHRAEQIRGGKPGTAAPVPDISYLDQPDQPARPKATDEIAKVPVGGAAPLTR